MSYRTVVRWLEAPGASPDLTVPVTVVPLEPPILKTGAPIACIGSSKVSVT